MVRKGNARLYKVKSYVGVTAPEIVKCIEMGDDRVYWE